MSQTLDSQANPEQHIEKEVLLNEMMLQVANLQKRFQSEGEDDERRWMIANASDPKIEAFLKDSTVMMLHVIDAIGEMEPVNGIRISNRFGIPRGSVSKITRRLAELHMVRSESLPGNRKEILFRLTDMGHQVYELHKRLHERMEHNVRNFLRRYDAEQMRFLIQCMKDTAEASWVETAEGMRETGEDRQGGQAAFTTQVAAEIGDILAMLRQLDARKLRKAKALLQIAFFDEGRE